MGDETEDWRITEGPAIGVEPVFELSDIRLEAHFFVTGSMCRRIAARLTTQTPTLVESLSRTLPQLSGHLTISDDHPERTVAVMHEGRPLALGPNRGLLALRGGDRYAVHLHLPKDQFADLLAVLAHAAGRASLRIEVERTIDQGVFEQDVHFWNDRISPVILFNEFEINLEPAAAVDPGPRSPDLG